MLENVRQGLHHISPKPSEFWMERSRSFCKDCRSCRVNDISSSCSKPVAKHNYPDGTRTQRRQLQNNVVLSAR